MKKITLTYLVSTALLAVIFLSQTILGDASFLDFLGWIYLIFSAISHSSQLMLLPYLLAVPFSLKWKESKLPAIFIFSVGFLIDVLALLDNSVYNLYRFHINGFIINMVFGENASQIFIFDSILIIKASFVVLLLGAINVGLYILVKKLLRAKLSYLRVFVSLVLITLAAQCIHIYGAAVQNLPITKCTDMLPHYYPLSANHLLVDMGIVDATVLKKIQVSSEDSDMNYPIHPIEAEKVDSLPNIVLIMIDSWNERSFDKATMPNVYGFGGISEVYKDHLSSSNGTTGSVFGVFTGISKYYWDSFDVSHKSPVLMSRLKQLGYDVQMFPSASLCNPPFNRVLFSEFPKISTETSGETAYDRDSTLTGNFKNYLAKRKSNKPFFSFLFYDLAHAIKLTKSQNAPFKPAWSYANYMALNNDTDPTEFFNLYRNCVHHVDRFIGEALEKMKKDGLLNNTVVIITGDHSQEFNENKKNYWGHNGNFSTAQIRIPLVYYYPGVKPAVKKHRTTHYDISPTLLRGYLGVKNPTQDYSMGYLLDDATPRDWHLSGSHFDFAFVRYNQILLRKNSGAFELTDMHLNPISSSELDAVGMDRAIKRMNRFYK